jgi:hypothetical protein
MAPRPEKWAPRAGLLDAARALRSWIESRPRLAHTERVNDADIAKNCHTSVEMIEKYYATHIKNRLAAAYQCASPEITEEKG